LTEGRIITLSGYGESRIEVKQSVFIGQAVPVRTAEEAEAFIASVRKKYPDARHTCYAWKIDTLTHMQKISDDGEPSGTAGMPILNVIERSDLTDIAVAVTRYFGGILLGKGGLVRAYTDAAVVAVDASGKVEVREGKAFSVRIGYDMSDKIMRETGLRGWAVEDTEYGADVRFTVVCTKAEQDLMTDTLIDITSGRAQIEKLGDREIRLPLI
jgi:uncharacterized YigZ family protein